MYDVAEKIGGSKKKPRVITQEEHDALLLKKLLKKWTGG